MQVSGDLVDWLEPTGSSLTAASALDDTLIARICGALPTEFFVTLARFGSLKNRVLYPKQRLGWFGSAKLLKILGLRCILL